MNAAYVAPLITAGNGVMLAASLIVIALAIVVADGRIR